MIELQKLKNELAFKFMDSMLNERNATYNFKIYIGAFVGIV